MESTLLCEEFTKASQYVHQWCDKQDDVGEESITDWLLFHLYDNIPQIKYKKFTRHQESRETGADWEWHFIDDKEFITLRIQAKRIKKNDKDLYSKLSYTPKNNYMQIITLLKDARHIKAIPLYAWYYASNNNKVTMCGRNHSNTGIFISDANQIFLDYLLNVNNAPTASVGKILKKSNPIQCLFCCPLSGNSARKILIYFAAYFDIYSSSKLIKPNSELPRYVLKMLKDDISNDEKNEDIDEDIDIERNLDFVIIADLRKSEHKNEKLHNYETR